jgi:hypothetical protein
MIKILLYISLLFASGIVAGDGLSSLDDMQLTQQLANCDQANERTDFDNGDPEVTVAHQNPVLLEQIPSTTAERVTTACLQNHFTSNVIRAPPLSL